MASVVLKGSGKRMPLVGFGLWKVNGDVAATVQKAINAGYRLFDGACDYGNEQEAGKGLKAAIDAGTVKREDVFITSKLWNSFHAPENVEKTVRKQLADWGLEYFDLFLIHFPVALKYIDPAERYPPGWFTDEAGTKVELENTPLQATWEALEKLVDKGLIRDIGVSNFSGSLILDIERYRKKPISVLQVELHPYLTQEPLLQLAKVLGIPVTAYSSFGSHSWVELGMDKKVPALLKDVEIINKVALETKKTTAQVLLRWATQRGIAVIPKTNDINDTGRLIENLKHTDFDLTEEQIKAISSLNAGIRFNNPAEIDPRLSVFA